LMSVATVVILAIYVLPKFEVFFEDLDAELPLITRVVLTGSSFLSQNWILILAALVAAFWGVRIWGGTDVGRVALDRFKLRVPFVGPVLHRFALAEFCRSLATLLSGGIPLVPAFEIGVSAVGNSFVRNRIEPKIQLVREGKPFHQALEESEIFTDMAVDMVKVGEATGSLDEMLTSVADFLDEQIETRMQRLLSLVEPLMLVFMGIIIAILLIAIYLPLFTMLGQSSIG
jgi:type II secretory pathway component PulF